MQSVFSFPLTYDYNTNSVGGVVEMNGSKVVYDGPSSEHRNYANSSTGHPSTFIVVSFDSEHRHPVESGENEQEAGVHVEEEEGLLGHITLGVDVGSADLERHVDDEPLGGDDHLHHDHEEERQKLIDLNTTNEHELMTRKTIEDIEKKMIKYDINISTSLWCDNGLMLTNFLAEFLRSRPMCCVIIF